MSLEKFQKITTFNPKYHSLGENMYYGVVGIFANVVVFNIRVYKYAVERPLLIPTKVGITLRAAEFKRLMENKDDINEALRSDIIHNGVELRMVLSDDDDEAKMCVYILIVDDRPMIEIGRTFTDDERLLHTYVILLHR